MAKTRVLFQTAPVFFIAGFCLLGLAACEVKGPATTGLDSTGGGGTGTVTTKTVTINWNASHARDVGLGGGGYKVYVKKGTAPSATDTTPIVIANPGGGIHTTTTTVPLSTGRYFVSISSFSTNGESPLSTATLVVVP